MFRMSRNSAEENRADSPPWRPGSAGYFRSIRSIRRLDKGRRI
jgi:hypothetical protein